MNALRSSDRLPISYYLWNTPLSAEVIDVQDPGHRLD
jgi:hypothetical protein